MSTNKKNYFFTQSDLSTQSLQTPWIGTVPQNRILQANTLPLAVLVGGGLVILLAVALYWFRKSKRSRHHRLSRRQMRSPI